MVTSLPPPSDSPATSTPRLEEEPLLWVAAVERETSLGKDTLRAWERRYGFPLPMRNVAGIRGYPRPRVDHLALIRRALIRRALLAGLRPGRLLGLPLAELGAVLASVSAAPPMRPGAATLLDVEDGWRRCAPAEPRHCATGSHWGSPAPAWPRS